MGSAALEARVSSLHKTRNDFLGNITLFGNKFPVAGWKPALPKPRSQSRAPKATLPSRHRHFVQNRVDDFGGGARAAHFAVQNQTVRQHMGREFFNVVGHDEGATIQKGVCACAARCKARVARGDAPSATRTWARVA